MKNNLNSQSLYPKVEFETKTFDSEDLDYVYCCVSKIVNHGRLSKPLIPLGLAGRSMASKEALNPLLLKDSSE